MGFTTEYTRNKNFVSNQYTCNAYLYKTNKLAYFVMLFLFIFGLCFVHIYLGTFWIFFFNIKQANLKQKNKKCRLRNPTCLIKSYQDLTVINHLMPVCYFKINTNTYELTVKHITLIYMLKHINIHIGLSSVALFY